MSTRALSDQEQEFLQHDQPRVVDPVPATALLAPWVVAKRVKTIVETREKRILFRCSGDARKDLAKREKVCDSRYSSTIEPFIYIHCDEDAKEPIMDVSLPLSTSSNGCKQVASQSPRGLITASISLQVPYCPTRLESTSNIP